jgi:hypothetical protein
VPTTPTDPGTRHRIQLMVLAMTAFTLNDTLVKVASETMLTGQLIFLRGVLATAFVQIGRAHV